MGRFNFAAIPGLNSSGFTDAAALQSQNLRSTLDSDMRAQQMLADQVQARIQNRAASNDQRIQLEAMRQQSSNQLAELGTKMVAIQQAREEGRLGRQFAGQQNALDRDLTRQGITSNENQVLFETVYQGGENALDRNLQRELANDNAGLQERLAQADIESRKRLSEAEINADVALSAANRLFQGDQARLDRIARSSNLDRELTDRLAIELLKDDRIAEEGKYNRYLELRLMQLRNSNRSAMPSDTALSQAAIIISGDAKPKDMVDTYNAAVSPADKAEIERAMLFNFRADIEKVIERKADNAKAINFDKGRFKREGDDISILRTKDLVAVLSNSGLDKIDNEFATQVLQEIQGLEPTLQTFNDYWFSNVVVGVSVTPRVDGRNPRNASFITNAAIETAILTPIIDRITRRITMLEAQRNGTALTLDEMRSISGLPVGTNIGGFNSLDALFPSGPNTVDR